MQSKAPSTVRRSVALPLALVKEVQALAPAELRHNLNRLVIVALQQFVAQQKAQAFEADMARMAADPQIQADCAAISREFLPTERGGLQDD